MNRFNRIWRVCARSILATTLIGSAGTALASAGDLDTTFGTTGVVQVGPTVESPSFWAVASKHDSVFSAVISGVPGSRTATVFHTQEDGSLDPSFGTAGSTLLAGTVADQTLDIAVDKRDRVIVAIQELSMLRTYRLTSAGAPDAAFGSAGTVNLPIVNGLGTMRIATQRDRKILIATGENNPVSGVQELSVRRLNENGSLDTTFGSGGVFRWRGPGPSNRTWGAGVGLQADGHIIVSGRYAVLGGGGAYNGYVLRLTTAGVLDATFGAAGETDIVWTPGNLNSARHLVVMGDDRIVTGGGSYDPATGAMGSAVLARLNPDGSFDATFGTGGKTLYPLPAFGGSWFHLGVASNNKIVLGGVKNEDAVDVTVTSGNILRFRDNGVIDTSFAGDGSFEYAPTTPPDVSGAAALLDGDDRPIGVFVQFTSPGATTAMPLLVRLEAGKKSCP
jgi:uncharacterized delta-60 repeat protein